MARRIIKKFKPEIIAITGSVGKTSAKEAIWAVIGDETVLKNEGNYNNEIGIPLTILGLRASSSTKIWISNIFKSFSKVIFAKRYYKTIVLEMGADHPGDIKYLTSFIKPDIAVVTAIGPAHLEFFGSIENVACEKMKLAEMVSREGTAVLNFDDKRIKDGAGRLKANIISYGTTPERDLFASDINLMRSGVNFKLHYRGTIVPIHLNLLGKSQVLAALAAIGVGISLGMDLVAISEKLLNYSPPEGRGNLIEIKDLLIINDTYNANPMSMVAALDLLDEIGKVEKKRRVAILGDMFELGKNELAEHEGVGEYAFQKADYLIAVGERGRKIEEGARKGGMEGDRLIWVRSAGDLLGKMKNFIKPDDLVLIKGSRAMKMERVIVFLKKEF